MTRLRQFLHWGRPEGNKHMISLDSTTTSALPLGNLHNLSSDSKRDFVFWTHSDRLHLNKAMSKAPDAAMRVLP